MTADAERQASKDPTSREETALRIRRGIRAAQLRVALDEARGREAPPAVVQLSQLPMPPLPSPFDAPKSPDGTLRRAPASRREAAVYLRRSIRAARLRVTLDEERTRPTPEAVIRLAQLKLPPLE